MRPKIGVMGSCGGHIHDDARGKAQVLGESIARSGCVLITGASPGLPYETVLGAKASGGTVVGISPALSLSEHVGRYESPFTGFDVIIYTGSGLMGREIENIRSSDIVIIVGGRSGTLGEFAIAYDEGKLIGVLLGTGGIADQVELLERMCDKETGAHVIYTDEPDALVDELLRYYRATHCGHPSCFG
jgi:uncharacterized protein (TIGR00725 family)